MEHSINRPLLCPKIIGRTPELAALGLLVEQTKEGRGQIALLSGEAGIGKSRLVAEVRTEASRLDFLFLQGTCFQADHLFPYAPLLDLLRTYLHTHAAEAAAALKPSAPALARLLPDLPLLLPQLAPIAVLPALDPEQEKYRLFAVLLHFFTGQAEHHPTLLVIEDIHWCDETSLEFLLHLAHRCAQTPLLLLCTYRSDESSLPLQHFLAELHRARLAQQITLLPLSRDEVGAMLSTMALTGSPLPADVLDTLYPLAEGNPFFVEELLSTSLTTVQARMQEEAGSRREQNGAHGRFPLPQSVQDAVRQRTERLHPEARRALVLAAVAGRRFNFAVLQDVLRCDEASLLGLMKELIAAQLVVEESSEQFAFRHALTRQAVYAQLLGRERKALHRAIAETLERLYASSVEAHLAELAPHFAFAGAWEKALAYGQRAGEQAQALYAPRAATLHFTRALDAAYHVSLTPPVSLYRARGLAYETLGEFERARADHETALQLAHEASERHGEWQALIDLGFLWAGRAYAQTGDYYQQALALARTMDDPATLAHSLNRLGNWHANGEQLHEALRCHQEALTIFQEVHNQHGVAETLDLLGVTSWLSADLLQSAAYYRQAVELFREMDNRQALVSSLATLLLCAGAYQTAPLVSVATGVAEVRREGEGALKLAREIGQRSGEAYTCCGLALCLSSRGEYVHALELAQGGLSIAEEIEHHQWMTYGHLALGTVYLDLLELTLARQHLEQALVLAKELGSLFWIRQSSAFLASVCIGQGDLAQAETLLTTALSSNDPPQTLVQRLIWYVRAQLALAYRKPDRALAITERLLASAVNVFDGRSIPHLSQLRGEALTMLNQRTEAELALQDAHMGAMTRGLRPLLWRIAIDLGKLYRAELRDEEAEHAFATAQELIEKLGAPIPDPSLRTHFLHQATALLPRHSLLSPRRAAKRAFGGLTEREREVAALIAQGKVSREIAAILVVNPRTVEKHIENILSKLGFTSRAQIAVWASEKGLEQKEQS